MSTPCQRAVVRRQHVSEILRQPHLVPCSCRTRPAHPTHAIHPFGHAIQRRRVPHVQPLVRECVRPPHLPPHHKSPSRLRRHIRHSPALRQHHVARRIARRVSLRQRPYRALNRSPPQRRPHQLASRALVPKHSFLLPVCERHEQRAFVHPEPCATRHQVHRRHIAHPI